MANGLAVSLWLGALIVAVAFLYGQFRWRRNIWLRDGITHMPHSSDLTLKMLSERNTTTPTPSDTNKQNKNNNNNLLQQAHEKFVNSYVPFCGLGFLHWLQPVVMGFTLFLERKVFKRSFNYYEEGIGSVQSTSSLDDYWMRRHFYMPLGDWGELRSELTPAFLAGDFKQQQTNVWQKAEHELIGALDTALTSAKDGDISLLELQDIFARYIIDVTGKCVFNLNLHSLDAPNDEYRQLYALLLEILSTNKSMDDVWEGLPISWLNFWHKHKLQMPVYNFCTQNLPAISKAQTDGQQLQQHNSLFNLLLKLNSRIKSSSSQLNITKETIKTSTNMLLLFVGALARSLADMTLTVYELARHQNSQTELRTEILAGYDKRYEFRMLETMEYLEHTIYETQRSYSTLPPSLISVAEQDYKTDFPGYTLRKGTALVSPMHVLGQYNVLYPDPKNWDVNQFAVVELMYTLNQMVRIYCGQSEDTDLAELQTSKGLMALLKNYNFTTDDEKTTLQFDDTLPILLLKQAPKLKVTRI